MPKESDQFAALRTLQHEFRVAEGIKQLNELVLTFMQEHLAVDRVDLSPFVTASSDAAGSTAEAELHVPVNDTGYRLQIGRATPFTEDEVAFVEMVAALLASAPAFRSPLRPTPPQLKLLQSVSEMIAGQQRFADVVQTLAGGFADAFPGATAKLLLLDRDAERLVVQSVVGSSAETADLLPLDVAGEVERAVTECKTIVNTGEKPPRVIVPVKGKDVVSAVEAVLDVVYPETAVLTPADTMAIELLAGYLGIALGNKNLREQAWQRANQLEAAYRITESAGSLKSLESTLKAIQEQLTLTFDAPTSYIALYDEEKEEISFPHLVTYHEPVDQEPISILNDKSLTAWVVSNNQPYATDDWLADEKPVAGIIHDSSPRSVMCVPMRAGAEVLGAISIQSDTPGAFADTDFQTLTTIASHVAVIISNARLYAKTRHLVDKGARDYQVAVTLRQAISVISTSLEQEVVLDQLLVALASVITYDVVFVFLREDDGFHLAASRDFYDRPLSVSIEQVDDVWSDSALLHEIVRWKETSTLNDVRAHERWPGFGGGEQIRAWMGTPLLADGKVWGALLINSYEEGMFGRREEWLASTLAAHASVALQNARLYHRTQQQISELSTLYQASATMTANLDQHFVLQTVVSEMVRALQVDSCTIFVWNEGQQSLKPAAHRNLVYPRMRPEDGDVGQSTGLSMIEQLEDHSVVQRVFRTQEIYSLRQDNAHTPDQVALLEAAQLQSVLLVPLVRRNEVLGLLALGQMSQPRAFSPGELRLTQNLASQAAVAIEHARLFSQAQRRVEELSTFHNIVLQLNTPLKLNAVLDAITESALRLVEASNLHIYLYDGETGEFTFGSALWRDGRREPAVSSIRPNGLTATVVQQANPIVINDASSHPLFQSEQAQAWGIYAIAGFPLKDGEQVIGAFTATYLYPHTFGEDELLLLNLLADQAAVAVRNARLFADSQRRLRDMSALVDMAKQVTGKLKLQSVLQTTVQILRRLLNARASTITMLSDDGTELVVAAADGVDPRYVNKARMKVGEGVSGEVVKRCELVYVRDAHSEPDFLFFDEILRSLLVVPLVIRDEAIGTLTVDSDKPYAFSDSDIQLMTIAAAQVSVAIANARLFEELEERAAELAVAYDELKESDRLKDELVQNVSHELRTPLTFVKGYVDLLMDGEMGLVSSEQLDALKIVSEKTDEITRIIDDIITLQRIDAGNLQLQVWSMSDLIRAAVAGHRMVAAKKGIDVACLLPSEKSLVMVDKGRINQVLDNLIGNAIKFSPNGGTITVKMYEQDDMVYVVVSDQGVGVPEEKQDRIFDRFYQADGSSRRRFGGTGIGLAIVKRIINAHRGRIWVESKVNQGSSFYFTLPKVGPELKIEEELMSEYGG